MNYKYYDSSFKDMTHMPWPQNRNGYVRPLSLHGRTQHMAAWAREHNIHPMTLKHRLSAGMSLEEALIKPLRKCIRGSTPERRAQQKLEQSRRVRALRGAAIKNFKTGKPCADCKVVYAPHILDFDHVRGEKLFDLSDAQDKSLKTIATEIAKCEIVCANCHRDRTEKRRLKI